MKEQPGREIRTWMLADDGSRTPLPGTGLRVRLWSGCWVAVDLHPTPRGSIVDVAVRAEEANRARMPRLAIVPHAGNSASIVIGDRGSDDDRRFEVVAVDEARLGDDLRGWLRRTTSGDPLGEVTLARPDLQPMPARRFVLEYGAIASIELALRASAEALLVVDVLVRPQQIPSRGSEYPTLDMSIRFGGSNLVSFWFQEVTAEIVEETDGAT